MENVKKYRVKTKTVTAMRTYLGQPLFEIRDFMIGCKNIGMSLSNVHEGFVRSIEGNGIRDLTPGDYIVMSEGRNAMFMSSEEFEQQYEEQVDSSELHYVIKKYGFPVNAAEMMLRDERIRPILLAPLNEQNKSLERTLGTVNVYTTGGMQEHTGKIAEKLGGILSDKCIRKYVLPQ